MVSIGLALKRRTIWYPVAFAAGGVVQFALLALLVPRWGSVAAARALAAGFAVVTGVRLVVGRSAYAQSYEIARMLKVGLAAGAVFALGSMIRFQSLAVNIASRSLVVCFGLPLLLVALRFLDAKERDWLRMLPSRLRQAWSA